MKIDMNKNFEEEFRVTFWKGLTARELATGIPVSYTHLTLPTN